MDAHPSPSEISVLIFKIGIILILRMGAFLVLFWFIMKGRV